MGSNDSGGGREGILKNKKITVAVGIAAGFILLIIMVVVIVIVTAPSDPSPHLGDD